MKLYQAVTIHEEVQMLHERVTVLLNKYFFLQPSLSYFLSSKLQQFTLNSAINTFNTCFSHYER